MSKDKRKIKKRKKKLKKNKIQNKYIIIISVIIVTIIFLTSLSCFMVPKIELIGKEEVVLEYPNEYKEPGYKAKTLIMDLTSKVKTKGKINNKKIGEYTITYELKNFFFKRKIVRIVKIVDKEKPTITFKGEENPKICPGKEYQEEGFEATDNYDGDLTEKVKINKEKEKWTYTVKDSSKNIIVKERNITYIDEQAPTIQLTNPNPMYITEGSEYIEPGYNATDDCDGDITSKVLITGSVNSDRVGTYELTYTVIDSSNNKTEIKRKIIVQRKKVSNSGVIYLTFDDGPEEGSTDKILNILKEENVKATFFVTCKGPDYLIQREYREGHTMALHSATHDYAQVYASADNYFNDLNMVSARVRNLTGVDSKIIRFPGGSSNTVSRRYQPGIMTYLTKEVLNRGYHYFDWNVDADDAVGCVKSASPSCVYNNVTRKLIKNRNNIVLMHDVKPYTADALRDIIRYGKNNGYTFEKLNMSTPMVWEKVAN